MDLIATLALSLIAVVGLLSGIVWIVVTATNLRKSPSV